MKKLICLFMMCLLCACTPVPKERSKIITESHDPIPEKLLVQIQETMPETVFNELKERGKCKNLDGTLRVSAGAQPTKFDYALCLDFSYDKDGTLTQFVYKPYSDGTFDNGTLSQKEVTQEEAIQVAENFAKVFFNEERHFHKSYDLSGYDTGDYITLADEFDNHYLIQLKGGLLLQYDAKE